jgi:hypothetical protein
MTIVVLSAFNFIQQIDKPLLDNKSKFAVGSSRISNSGLKTRAVAKETFFFSPELNL